MNRFIVISILTFLLSGCFSDSSTPHEAKKADLTIYSGITMVRPLSVLAQEFEKQHNIKIEIKQGASGYLYKTLKIQKDADIYFPGSDSYRTNNLADGIWGEHVFVGYNRVAIMVPKGNPQQLTNDIRQLIDPELSVVLSSPESGAVGKNSKKILDQVGITDDVYKNVTYFTTDSHRIFRAIKEGHADIALNWYAAASWPETKDYMQAILLPPEIAKPKKLELNLMAFSTEPQLSLQFMRFAASEKGLRTFAEYGFLTDIELQKALKKDL